MDGDDAAAPQAGDAAASGGDTTPAASSGPLVHSKEYVQMLISASTDLYSSRPAANPGGVFVPVSRRPNRPSKLGIYGSEGYVTSTVAGYGRRQAAQLNAGDLDRGKLAALRTASRRVNRVVDWSKRSRRRDAGSRQYLQRTMYPVLTEGLRQLVILRPENPLEWLGNFFLAYPSEDEELRRMDFPE